MSTKFFTNSTGNTLFDKFKGIAADMINFDSFLAVVGFFRSSGYFKLRKELGNVSEIKILVGINIDDIFRKHNKALLMLADEDKAKEIYHNGFKEDIINAQYSPEVEEGILQMCEDLVSGRLQMRIHATKNLHAKFYLCLPQNHSEHSDGWVIMGSSNISDSGLGIKQPPQYELNVAMKDFDDVKYCSDEFWALWNEAVPLTVEDIEEYKKKTYLGYQPTPYELYIKVLIDTFGDQVEDDFSIQLPDGVKDLKYQKDAVIQGYQMLMQHNGLFLADVVGLGKTVIATMIAKKFLIENGRDKTKILVVYPPAVEHNWKATFKDFGIDKFVNFISNGSLSKILDEDNYNYWNADEFDLILVDEAHKFRSHTTSAFEQLQEICKMPRIENGNIPGFKKKVMLISATPMNNTPADIYTEIQLFQDPRRCTIDGVSNLTAFFSPLIKEFKQLKREPNFDISRFKKLAERVRDRVIKPLTVRRTRTDIENVPRYNKDVNGFPKVERPIESRYELNEHLADLFEHAMLTLEKNLTYARYQAIAYLKPEAAQGLYDNAELISRSLAGIRKNGLVKRLESSFYAFQVSLDNFRQANQNMIDMFDRNKVFIAPDLDINMLLESGLSDEEIEEKLNAKAEDNPKNAVFTADDFKPEFIEMLRGDQNTLEMLCSEWADIKDEDDSKFTKFNELLKHKLFKSERNPEQKLVVFSESVDTVEYLARRINRKDVLVISADNRSKQFKTIRENFDANYKTKLNDYNIILTTDVLAEGVNLHRANVIVNYDTPWNSTRLMQRIGRVNRIGSSSKHIYNYVFYPSREGNREINLNQIALSKIQTFHSTFGEDNQIYSQEEILDRDLSKLFDEGMKKQKEECNQELPYYEELRALYQNNRREYNRIAKLSLRSRTGREMKKVDGVTLANDTLVFLKTNFRKVFFLVSETAEELSVLDALKYFKAPKEEQSAERIEQHHKHINMALRKFRMMQDEEARSQETTHEEQGSVGVQVSTAVNLLNNFIREIDDNELYIKVVQLKTLAERGVITYIAKRLQRIQKNLRRVGGKARMTHDEALAEIIDMAKKYAPYYTAQESLLNEQETNAEIILSESFNKL